MKYHDTLKTALFAASLAVAITACNSNEKNANQQQTADSNIVSTSTTDTTLRFINKVELPDVKGGFDLMSLDLKTGRLFLSAQDNHSLEVIDLDSNKLIKSIPNLEEPKWSFFDADKNRIYVATGLDGKVTEFDGKTYKKIKEFQFKETCNNLRYDANTKQLFVGMGKTFGALGIIDLEQDKIIGEIPLSGYLKQFEIDGNRIYVNIKSKNLIDVVDRVTKRVIASWPVTTSTENVPMAIDRDQRRLFIGCEPGKFIVFSTATGKPVADLTISKDADGIYYDSKRKLIYVSCGEGTVQIIKQANPDTYRLVKTIPTVAGAGTSLYSAQLDRFILATPKTENQPAGISIYQPEN